MHGKKTFALTAIEQLKSIQMVIFVIDKIDVLNYFDISMTLANLRYFSYVKAFKDLLV
jgi:hypothetical protein